MYQVSEEHRMLRDLVKKFVRNELMPGGTWVWKSGVGIPNDGPGSTRTAISMRSWER